MAWRSQYPYGRQRLQAPNVINIPWAQIANGVQPAAGVDTTIVFGKGSLIRPLWFQIDLVTSAVAGTRDVSLNIDFTFPRASIALWTTAGQLPGTERIWTWVLNFNVNGINTGAATNIYSFLPDLKIKTDVTFRTNSRNLDVADQFKAPFVIYEDLTP